MNRLGKIFLAGTLALLLAFSGNLHSVAQDTTAVAINTRDGSSIFRLAFQVRRVMSDVVDQGNAAVAFSSCDECRTVAVAIQLVLVLSDPDVVSPENVAIAINSECDLCTTIAHAYQFVLTTGGPVRFDAEGNRELAEIRLALRKLLSDDSLSPEDLQTELDGLVERLETVVNDHLLPAGSSGEAVQQGKDGEPQSEETTAESPSSSPTAEQNESASPSPEPEPSQSAGDEVTETPSPAPSS